MIHNQIESSKKNILSKMYNRIKKSTIQYYEIFTFLTNHKNLYSTIKNQTSRRQKRKEKKVEKLGELAQS